MKRPLSMFVLGALFSILAIGSIHMASAANPSKIIYACSDKKTGALRYNPRAKCTSKEQLIAWNVTGATGSTGLQGEPGLQGLQGPRGQVGDIGPAGPSGTDGAEGAVGQQGPAGADGANVSGLIGTTGLTGPAGSDGATGPTGPAGSDGATGPTGPAGADGATGPTGPAGSDGAPGAPGAFILKDGNGDSLGKVLSSELSCWVVWNGTGFNSYYLTTGRPCDPEPSPRIIYWSSTDCAGTAYLKPTLPTVPTNIFGYTTPVVFEESAIGTTDRYSRMTLGSGQVVAIYSNRNMSGVCTNDRLWSGTVGNNPTVHPITAREVLPIAVLPLSVEPA
jgi:hypothetical protein